MSQGRGPPGLSVVGTDPLRPRSSSGRALTWDGRNPAVRLPPVLMEELELMSHGVAVVRRKSKVTYADIIAWLLDQCPEQVAQVKALCPPETRAKFMPRSDLGGGSQQPMLSSPSAVTGLPAHLTHELGVAVGDAQVLAHMQPGMLAQQQQQLPGLLTQQGVAAAAAARGGSVHWLVPPNVLARYPGVEGELVEGPMSPDAMMGGPHLPVPQRANNPQARKQQSQQQLLQQQLQQPVMSAAAVQAVPSALQTPAPQQQQQQHQEQQQQRQQQELRPALAPSEHLHDEHINPNHETDPEGTDVDITIDDAAENERSGEKAVDADVDVEADIVIVEPSKRVAADTSSALPPKKAKVVEIAAKEAERLPEKD